MEETKDLCEMLIELEDAYNEICRATMIKAATKTKEISDKVIPIKNFDHKNPEHLYVLAISRALGGILGVQVAVDVSRFRRWWMNRKIKVEGSKILPYLKEYDEHAIDPDELLAPLREWAEELCGDNVSFCFGDIYYEFYA
jgi:hypothetical protein